MVTKLKNWPYNWLTKTLSVLLLLSACFFFLMSMYILLVDGSFYTKESYYDTEAFCKHYVRLTHNVVDREVNLKNHSYIEEHYENENTMLLRLNRIENNLHVATTFLYVIYDLNTHSVVRSNVENPSVDSLKGYPTAIAWDEKGYSFPYKSELETSEFNSNMLNNYSYYNSNQLDIKNNLSGTNYVVYTAITGESDDYFFRPIWFKTYKATQYNYTLFAILMVIVALITFVQLTIAAGKDDKNALPKTIFYDKVPTEIQLGFTSLFFIPAIMFGQNLSDPPLMAVAILSAFICLFILMLFFFYQSQVRRIKTNQFLKGFLIFRVLKFIIELLSFKNFKMVYSRWVLLLLLGFLITNFLLTAIFINTPIGLLFIILLTIGAYALLLKELKSIQMLMDTIHNRSSGNIDYPLNPEDLSSSFTEGGEDLNTMQEGLKIALDEAIKGEQLKTELITNVTHDLKTPLTSIINYVDLLSQQDMPTPESEEYIAVLTEKSNRLKLLIDQLVEASKASSGNLDISKSEIDIIELLNQLLGEYEDAFNAKGLTTLTKGLGTQTFITTDNALLYRVLENLLSNIKKYAMDHTRVYIDFAESENHYHITLKNISATPLNMDINTLQERFVRGDEARHIEGNGLGLSIANSLSQLLGYTLDIIVDGDLFKVVLVIPK